MPNYIIYHYNITEQYKAFYLYKRGSILTFYSILGANYSLINPTSSILELSSSNTLSPLNLSSPSLLELQGHGVTAEVS